LFLLYVMESAMLHWLKLKYISWDWGILSETEILCPRLRCLVWDKDTLSKTYKLLLPLQFHNICSLSLALYFLQQSTSSLLHVSLTHLLFTSSLLLYRLYCWSLYLHRLHILVLHPFATSTSTLILYGFRLPHLHHTTAPSVFIIIM